MGNCQAAEAATVVIVHPGNKVERIYWSVSARHVMNANAGHYVALVLPSAVPRSENGLRVKQLKLLRPDDTLLIGQVYRLISFEDVLKEFAAKKCAKLGKLLKEKGVIGLETKQGLAGAPPLPPTTRIPNASSGKDGSGASSSSKRGGRHQHNKRNNGEQWKPALKSISEIGL